MSNNSTNAVQFSGPYLIQDSDHLSTPVATPKAKRSGNRQSEQSNSANREQVNGKSRTGQRQAH